MGKVLNEKCRQCDMCFEVTQTITGVYIKNPWFQCIADVEADCLEGEEMMMEEQNE